MHSIYCYQLHTKPFTGIYTLLRKTACTFSIFYILAMNIYYVAFTAIITIAMAKLNYLATYEINL